MVLNEQTTKLMADGMEKVSCLYTNRINLLIALYTAKGSPDPSVTAMLQNIRDKGIEDTAAIVAAVNTTWHTVRHLGLYWIGSKPTREIIFKKIKEAGGQP